MLVCRIICGGTGGAGGIERKSQSVLGSDRDRQHDGGIAGDNASYVKEIEGQSAKKMKKVLGEGDNKDTQGITIQDNL